MILCDWHTLCELTGMTKRSNTSIQPAKELSFSLEKSFYGNMWVKYFSKTDVYLKWSKLLFIIKRQGQTYCKFTSKMPERDGTEQFLVKIIPNSYS